LYFSPIYQLNTKKKALLDKEAEEDIKSIGSDSDGDTESEHDAYHDQDEMERTNNFEIASADPFASKAQGFGA